MATNNHDSNVQESDIERIERKLDALTEHMATLAAGQQALTEFYDEMAPIATLAMGAGAERLSELEKRGYFDFGRELLHVIDQVVTGYTPDDVHALGDNITRILDLVRAATQPAVIERAEQAGEAMEHAGDRKPLSILGLLRKVRKDEDLRRGLNVVLEGLRQIGKAVHSTQAGDGRRINPLLGQKRNLSRRRALPPASDKPNSKRQQRPAADSQAKDASPAKGTVAVTVDVDAWTEEIAVQIADSLGIELGKRHWQVLRFAREEYLSTSKSPNIRRITTGSGVPTKELYQLFPRAPAKTVATIAGLPRPVGCI